MIGKLICLTSFLTFCTSHLNAAPNPETFDVGVLTTESDGNPFEGALKDLGWKGKAYRDSPEDWERLKSNLEKHDIIVGMPGLRKILPQADGSPETTGNVEALRAFMEKGGAIVLTGAVGQEQLSWLKAMDPKFEITRFTPPKKPTEFRIGETTPPHSFRSSPGLLEDTRQIDYSYQVKADNEWEAAARWSDKPCILVKRFGKGFVVLSTLRHPDASLLRNTARMLTFQRMGFRYIGTEHEFGGAKNTSGRKIIAPGRGETKIIIKSMVDEPLAVEGIFRMSNGTESRDIRSDVTKIKPREVGSIPFPVMADLRGKTTVQVLLLDPSNGSEIPLLEEQVDLPEFLTVIPPTYRGMISTARRDKNVHFKIRFSPLYENIEGLPLKLTVTDHHGNLVSEKDIIVPSEEFPVEMELPIDAPAGEYTITAVARSGAAGERTAQGTFKIVPVRPGQVFVDQDTVILKDGKPFFPIGIYHVTGGQADAAAEIGFNIFQFWERDATPENMDRLAAKGINALWEGDAWARAVVIDPATAHEDAKFQAILKHQQEVAAKLKSHPALSMWYLADEPGSYHLPSLRQINNSWHQADEDHPTYLVATGEYHLLHEAADLLAIDVYPIYMGHRKHFSLVANATDAAMKGVDHRKPLIAIPQSFGNNKRHQEKPEDVRTMSYLFLTHGVKGMIWYCWKETGDPTGEEGAGNHPDTQKVLKELVSELKVFSPALLEPGSRMLKSDDGKIHAIICGSDDTGRYLLFVNDDSKSSSESLLKVPELSGKLLEGLFGTSPAKVEDGALKLKVTPQGTGVFRIK